MANKAESRIEIRGLNELFYALEKKKTQMDDIKRIVDKAASVAESEIKGYKWSQGYTQGNIVKGLKRHVSDGGRSVTIDTTARNSSGKPYAQFPEFGKHGPEQPAFRDAQKKGQEELKKLAKELLEK